MDGGDRKSDALDTVLPVVGGCEFERHGLRNGSGNGDAIES
jgi:hypothetical protein